MPPHGLRLRDHRLFHRAPSCAARADPTASTLCWARITARLQRNVHLSIDQEYIRGNNRAVLVEVIACSDSLRLERCGLVSAVVWAGVPARPAQKAVTRAGSLPRIRCARGASRLPGARRHRWWSWRSGRSASARVCLRGRGAGQGDQAFGEGIQEKPQFGAIVVGIPLKAGEGADQIEAARESVVSGHQDRCADP